MFEVNMDEYLDEEVESVKLAFDVICKDWEREVSLFTWFYSILSNLPASKQQPQLHTQMEPASFCHHRIPQWSNATF